MATSRTPTLLGAIDPLEASDGASDAKSALHASGAECLATARAADTGDRHEEIEDKSTETGGGRMEEAESESSWTSEESEDSDEEHRHSRLIRTIQQRRVLRRILRKRRETMAVEAVFGLPKLSADMARHLHYRDCVSYAPQTIADLHGLALRRCDVGIEEGLEGLMLYDSAPVRPRRLLSL